MKPSSSSLQIASWNIESLTEEKLVAIQRTMEELKIDIICLQEIHKTLSGYYETDDGYLVILSGSATNEREYAGVGFIVAPLLRKSIVGFVQASARMASLKIRIPGGKMAIFSAYAPQSGRHYDERQEFFQNLASFVKSTSSHGPKIICGDFNARLYRRLPGEEEIMGQYIF